jgi:hypothetical protein
MRKGELGKLVRGPVVVLDVDTGSVTTFCTVLAEKVAHDISLKLIDPTRRAPKCTQFPDSGRTRCVQLSVTSRPQQTIDHVQIDLDDRDSRRVRSIVVGTRDMPTGSQTAGLAAQVAGATCP